MSGDAMARLEAWRASGAFVEVPCTTGTGALHRVWTRAAGEGPWLTLIHGFPTSSFDMCAVAELLQASRRTLALDMVGFGESDRPLDHVYSVSEQADAVVAMWRANGVRDTAVLAHDLGATVAQELLWRLAAGRLDGVRLRAVVLANGGIFPELHRPLPLQTALADPQRGAAVAASITEEAMSAGLRLTYGPSHQPSDGELHATWAVMSHGDGHHNLHLLIRYMEERRLRAADWVGALTATDVPLGFVWGMLDPISGAHMAERIVAELPAAPRRLLDGVGHWPPIEAPEVCAEMLREVDLG
ncbi:MAG TPA: alpha/beta hydrolase [Candidatus Dormibacteraeota bacterium]|nr:alpha/beta hydrolase [Candidatus Dormibacteraeota bacterium]